MERSARPRPSVLAPRSLRSFGTGSRHALAPCGIPGGPPPAGTTPRGTTERELDPLDRANGREALGESARPRARSALAVALAFTFLFGLQSVSLIRQHPPFLEDDAAFVLRYAENLAAGHGFRWNVEEPPVWGASAPFWALFLAGGVKLGLSAAQSSLVWSVCLALAATGVLGVVALRVSGVAGVVALAPLLSINHLYSSFATSGMESPLTFLVVALALAVSVLPARGALVGLAAGLCLVHKVDLAPLGIALLVGLGLVRRERLRTALPVACAVALLWYGFALWHFGSPVPNSFLRKLTAPWGQVPRGWFAENLFLKGAGEVRLLLALIGLVVLRRRPLLAGVTLSALLVPSLAYTLKPPSEPFMWYVAAASPALAFLSACGLARVLRSVAGPGGQPLRFGVASILVAGLAWFLVDQEYPRTRDWHKYLTAIEPPLVQAGEWVDRHAPLEARLLTCWGHPAYASRRFVYDWTFLNRRFEKGSLLDKYTPEAWIALPWRPLERFPVPPQYRIVQVFRPPAELGFVNYSAVVLFRRDVPVLEDAHARAPEDHRTRSAELARGRMELALRLHAGETVRPGDVSEELLRSAEDALERARARLATLPPQAREALALAPWVEELGPRIEELRRQR